MGRFVYTDTEKYIRIYVFIYNQYIQNVIIDNVLYRKVVMLMKYKKDKTKQLLIRVSDSDLERLDRIAAAQKRTRSDVVRLLIAKGDNHGQQIQNAI